MATMVANGSVPNMPGPVGPASKRYRPAPAKTFQCRGYGDCRMVFSRSEHLARHIRKHTGERPFSCHCGKQFSRLDNLRQHAQTVHADKQEENEQMMRDLTTLHATMAAANKVGGSRGGRRAVPPVTTLHLGGSPTSVSPNQGTLSLIKQEDMSSIPMHQRPGTSTGYEGSELYPWQNEMENRRNTNNHSFRDPGQSFLAPSSSNSAAGTTAQSHSFRNYSGFTDNSRPRSSSSRPPTSSGLTDTHLRSLPPLAAVVSASLPSPPSQHSTGVSTHQQLQQHQSQSVFSFPGSLELRRPSTASRPGTAPASASSLFASQSASKSAQYGMARQQPDLSLLHSGFGPGRSASSPFGSEHQQHFQLGAGSDGPSTGADTVPTSPSGHDTSPFYFHPPDSASSSSSSTSPPSVNNNPRKRAFAGPDGPYDHASSAPVREHQPPGSSSGLLLGLNLGGLSGPGAAPDSFSYDYGSESRPQSRRLTVMELCNDNEQQRPPSSSAREQFVAGSGAFLLSAAAAAAAGGYGYGPGYAGGYASYGSTSRPTTSSGLVSSASALHIFDRASSSPGQPPSPQQHQFAHQQQLGIGNGGVSPTTGGAGNGATGAGGEASQEFRGSGVYPASFRVVQQQQQSSDAYAPVSPHPASSASHASTPTPPQSAGVLSPSTSSSSGHFASAQRSFQQQSAYSSQYQQSSYPTSFAQQQFPQHPSSQQQHQQQHFHQHQQFAHSPTFSDASASSAGGHSPYSPRSPLSDTAPPVLRDARGDGGFRSPPHHLQQQQQQQQQFGSGGGGTGHGHGGGQHAGVQQLDGQVRVTVSPYATAAYGMIF